MGGAGPKGPDKRKALAATVQANVGISPFVLGPSMRASWLPLQRADQSILPYFKSKPPQGFRVADDGLIERLVSLPAPFPGTWVPVVPDGNATAHLTWKRWLFLQLHTGLGGHLSAEKTVLLLQRQVWWKTIKEDVENWVKKCLTCQRFRKVPQRTEQVPTIPTGRDCWEEVMVDLEGPSQPPDKDGCCYVFTYICCLCHGIILEPVFRLQASHVRRAFANCIFRSGTIPTLVRSDRGPELKNQLMNEFAALVGTGRRFGTPWRPMEQGLVESRHRETQKLMGMLVKDVMQCFPNETGELLHVVEFIVYVAPGPLGYSPRDIDKRWSLSVPIERDAQPFALNAFEPVSEYLTKLFGDYQQIKVRILGHLLRPGEDRAR